MLASLEMSFGSVAGTDLDGSSVADPLSVSVLAQAQNGGYVHLACQGGRGPVKSLQAFVSIDKDRFPFVELSFFPDDLERTAELRRAFFAWLESMKALLGARRYYVRYEHASWKCGDTGVGSGVFLVSDDVADDA
jgi:hypothetical protein